VATTDISTSMPAITVKPGGTITIRDPDGGSTIEGVTIWAIPVNPDTGEVEPLEHVFLLPSSDEGRNPADFGGPAG
jgi:hypothetical protein